MGKYFLYTIFIFYLLVKLCYAQNHNHLNDVLKPLFRHKWTSDYSILSGRKVGNKDTLTQISFSFKTDHTFILKSRLGKREITGTWEYDPKDKMTNLKINGRSTSSIISISDTVVVMKFMGSNGMPSDLASGRYYYKPKR